MVIAENQHPQLLQIRNNFKRKPTCLSADTACGQAGWNFIQKEFADLGTASSLTRYKRFFII